MDTIDRQILAALQKNSRITNADLARHIGLAPSSTLERVRRLQENGTLQGFTARLNPQALGLDVQALVSVTLIRHDPGYIEQFEIEVQKIPYMTACYHLTGRFDYLLHLAVRDLEHLGQFIKGTIAALPHVGQAETFVVLSEVKQNGGLTVELDAAEDEPRREP